MGEIFQGSVKCADVGGGGMKLEEYLSAVTEQIRCKKVRESVSDELREHIEDQAAAYAADGMFEEEALEKAVRDMGDPVETGVSLDRVHRPRMSADILILAGIIAVFSIAVHAALAVCRSEYTISGMTYLEKHIIYTVMGYLLMMLVYRLDYSIFARWGRQIAGGFLAAVIIWQHFFGLTVNGATLFYLMHGLVQADYQAASGQTILLAQTCLAVAFGFLIVEIAMRYVGERKV